MSVDAVPVASAARHAEVLVDWLVDNGPSTAGDACDALGWTRGRFDAALREARDGVCVSLGLVIPHPTPSDGWLYRVTTEWQHVEAGASHSLGSVETRLASILRDVIVIEPHLDRGSVPWRRAQFLKKHLTHITGTLKEINDGEG